MTIRRALRREQQEFENRPQLPRAIGVVFLLAVVQIGLLCWKFFAGDLHWRSPILMGGFCAIQMVMVGWVLYLGARSRRAGLDGRTV